MAYVRTRLGRLFYEACGAPRAKDDPPIVLLHGLLFDSRMWKAQVEPLAELGRVVMIDGPGHGRSEPPPRFMLEEHADALHDAFGELGIARAILVGLSWGGMIGMRFALQHPRQALALALMDTTAEAEGLVEKVRYRALTALHRRVGLPEGLYRKEVAPLLFGPRTLATNSALVDASYRHAMGMHRDGIARAVLAVLVHRKNILDRIHAIDVPTVVVVGQHDASTTPDKSANIAREIPGAKLVTIEGAGHMSALEAPDAVNAVLVPFVRDALAAHRRLRVADADVG